MLHIKTIHQFKGKNLRIVPLKVEPQLLAYKLDRSFYAQATVLYTENDSCGHTSISPTHHLLHTPPDHTRKTHYQNVQLFKN